MHFQITLQSMASTTVSTRVRNILEPNLTCETEMAWPNNVRQNLTCDVDNAFKGAIKNAGRTGPYIMG